MQTFVGLYELVMLNKCHCTGGNHLKKVYKLLLIFCTLNIVDYFTTMLSVIRVLWETNSIFGLICIYNVVAYFIQKYDFALR